MNENTKKQVIDAFKAKKISFKELAGKLFMTERQLLLLLKSWGVESTTKKHVKVPIPDRHTLMVLYSKEKTTPKVAAFYGVSVGLVNRWMKELSIPARRMKLSETEKLKLLEEHVSALDVRL